MFSQYFSKSKSNMKLNRLNDVKIRLLMRTSVFLTVSGYHTNGKLC